MQLSQWLKANKVTLAKFGEMIGRTEATVSRIARGKHVPSFDIIEKIEVATDRKVTRDDFSTPARQTEAA